ncbi:MAG: sulfatase [Cyclobacteriaceae bacterium]
MSTKLLKNNNILRILPILVIALLIVTGNSYSQDTKPNFLIIYGDDANYEEFSLYGGKNIDTPNIDRLAKEGLTFNKVFQAIAICAPSRAELYTGMYPVRNGVAWNHATARPGIKSIVHHLGDLGYRVGITGKLHAGPKNVFPFQELDILKGGDIDGEKLQEYAEQEQPFALIIASGEPHEPWNRGNPDKFDPDKLHLPPYFVDTQYTRELYTNYLAEMEHLDLQVGQSLKALEKSGKANNTLVLFTSEHGSPFPGGKWTNWNTGVHTAFVARWPGVISPGQRTDALIQYADVLPTLVDIVGGTVNKSEFDGTSFLPVLKGDTDQHREYVYFMHNNVPEGPPYPIRSVTNGTHHYIRNLTPENIYIEKHIFGGRAVEPFLVTWFYKSTTDTHARNMLNRFIHRPAEELYNMEQDPFEFENLAAETEFENIKRELSNALDAWMESQNDPGEALDSWEAYKNNGGYLDE